MIMEVTSEVTPADVQSAFKFIRKRVHRHRASVDGLNAALYSVMLVSGKTLIDTGFSVADVESVLDQFKQQVCQNLRDGGAR